jgi:hypothetical protein
MLFHLIRTGTRSNTSDFVAVGRLGLDSWAVRHIGNGLQQAPPVGH